MQAPGELGQSSDQGVVGYEKQKTEDTLGRSWMIYLPELAVCEYCLWETKRFPLSIQISSASYIWLPWL